MRAAPATPARPETAGLDFGVERAPYSGRYNWPRLFAAFVFCAAFASCAYIYSGCCITLRPPIRSDGFGYYAYLPAIFIDHDLTMKTAMANRRNSTGMSPVARTWNGIAIFAPTGKLLDKYTLGTALLQSPFFVAAQATASAFHMPPYSLPYQISTVLSALVFLSIGTFLLVRYLTQRFSVAISILSACSVVFGTSLFHDATFLASYSHAYSFFLFALLLSIAGSYRDMGHGCVAPSVLHSLGLGATVGLIALTRVPNLVGGIVPLALVCDKLYRTRSSRVFALELSLGAAAFLFVFALQMAYWHAVTGRFFLNSYQGEQFNWLDPQLLNFLFSVRGGLFLWSPILLIAVLGLPLLAKRDKPLAIAVLAVLTLEVYICSSWWSWWFGMSFECRPVADMMPLIALPLACGFEWLSARFGRHVPTLAVSALIPLNLWLMLSFWNQFIPWDNPSFADLARLPAIWSAHSIWLRPKR